MNKDRYNATKDHRSKDVVVSPEFLQRKQAKIDEAEALRSLQEHYGWKLLLENFINPRLSIDRFLSSNPKAKNLANIRSQMLVLTDMLDWIEGQISGGKFEGTIVNRIKNSEEEN